MKLGHGILLAIAVATATPPILIAVHSGTHTGLAPLFVLISLLGLGFVFRRRHDEA